MNEKQNETRLLVWVNALTLLVRWQKET